MTLPLQPGYASENSRICEEGRDGICTGDKHQYDQTDADRIFPGDGILPLKEAVATLREIGYSGVVSLELFNPNYWEMPPQEATWKRCDGMTPRDIG